MLRFLKLEGVGPAPVMELELSERLNVLTGDNGLGKSFILEIAWWALTRSTLPRSRCRHARLPLHPRRHPAPLVLLVAAACSGPPVAPPRAEAPSYCGLGEQLPPEAEARYVEELRADLLDLEDAAGPAIGSVSVRAGLTGARDVAALSRAILALEAQSRYLDAAEKRLAARATR
jgi:hypothetical protein